MLFLGVLVLWSGAALLVARFVIDVDGPPALPTQSFLRSGAGRVLDIGAGTGRSSIMVLESRPQATLVALDLFADSFEQHFGRGESPQQRLLANLKASFLHACGPPCLTSGAAVHEQRSEAEFGPRLIGDYHEQKISAGFYYTGGFRERLIDPLAIKVIDRIRADDCIEGGAFEGKTGRAGRLRTAGGG